MLAIQPVNENWNSPSNGNSVVRRGQVPAGGEGQGRMKHGAICMVQEQIEQLIKLEIHAEVR